jgi:hypothetical protein
MTDQHIQQQILKGLRDLRSSFNSHATETAQRLTALKKQMDRLVAASPALERAGHRRYTCDLGRVKIEMTV